MKALKIAAGILITLVVLLGIVAVLALTPAVQTWAVRRALAGQPGARIEIGHVAAGMSDAELRDIHVVQDGIVITAKTATAKYSAWDYISHRRVNVGDVTVTDLLVDLRAATPAAAGTQPAPGVAPADLRSASAPGRPAQPSPASGPAAAPSNQPPFGGVLGGLQVPVELRVDRLAVAGRALLPHDQSATFDLKGANLATGARGQLDFRADFADARPAAALRAAHATGTIGLHLAADRRIDAVDANIDAVAEGPRLPRDHVKLEARAEQKVARGDEAYSVRIAMVHGGSPVPLLNADAKFDAAAKQIAGKWALTVRTDTLGTLVADLGLPDTNATGHGNFAVKTDNYAITTDGTLAADVAGLEKLAPALAAVGGMHLAAEFNGGLNGNIARLERLQLNATARDGRHLVEVQALQPIAFAVAEKRVQLANPQAEVARISLTSMPLAWAQPFLSGATINGGTLSMTLAVEAAEDGSRIRARGVEPLAVSNLTLSVGGQKRVENLSLSVQPTIEYAADTVNAQLADLKIATPAGDTLAGQLRANVTKLSTKPAVAFSGNLQGKVVEALKPYLPIDPGPLALDTKFDGAFADGVLRLTQADATVNREGGALLSDVNLQQPIAVKLASLGFTVAKADASVARVRLGEIPLPWAQRFVPKSKFAGTLTGASLDVTARSADELALNTTAPIELRAVDVALGGRTLLQKLDVTADLAATKQGDNVTFDVRRLELKQGATALASMSAKGNAKLGAALQVAAKGKLDADAAALLRQPVLASLATLQSGQVAATFDGEMAGKAIRAKADITARGLVAQPNQPPLGDVAITLNATLKPDGSGTLTMPIVVTNSGRRSDVALDGTIAQAGTTYSFNGKVTSNQIIVDDLQPFAALAPASPPSATTPAAAGQTPRTAPGAPATPRVPMSGSAAAVAAAPAPAAGPVWKGIGGRIDVDLKKVLYGQDYTIAGVHGTMTVTDTRLALDGLEGKFKDNPFKVTAAITYAANQPQPYSLTGAADVTNLDLGALLRAANPNEKPAIETQLTVSAKLNGKAASLPELAQNAYGQFDVAGTKGVLRALGKKGQTVSTVSSIVGLLGAARGSDTTVAVGELGTVLAEMPFDQFKAHLDRDANLNLKLTTLEFLSPSMRLTGTGTITYQKGVPLQNQVLETQLTLAGKGTFATLLNRAGLLGGNQDEKGYAPMRTPFVVRGTLANTDARDLWKIIGENAARAAVGSFLGGR